jgi:nucleotide-binding universal stress UspA family protein
MYQRILVAIDGSSTSTRGLDEAIELARATGATLRLLHVLDVLVFVTGFETCAAYTNDTLPRLKADAERILSDGKACAVAAGIGVETKLLECFAVRASDLIVEQAQAWKADLIVLGTHGRRGLDRVMLGSDGEQVARMATVPVLLVRAAETKRAEAARGNAGTASAAAAGALTT